MKHKQFFEIFTLLLFDIGIYYPFNRRELKLKREQNSSRNKMKDFVFEKNYHDPHKRLDNVHLLLITKIVNKLNRSHDSKFSKLEFNHLFCGLFSFFVR